MSQSTNTLSPDQIVTEISEIRKTMGKSAQRVLELSKALYSYSRRAAGDTSAPAYIAYSNAWMRFSGALTQGLKRTETTDRLIERARQEAAQKEEAAIKRAAELKRREQRLAQKQAPQNALGDLIALYGEEMVLDGGR